MAGGLHLSLIMKTNLQGEWQKGLEIMECMGQMRSQNIEQIWPQKTGALKSYYLCLWMLKYQSLLSSWIMATREHVFILNYFLIWF